MRGCPRGYLLRAASIGGAAMARARGPRMASDACGSRRRSRLAGVLDGFLHVADLLLCLALDLLGQTLGLLFLAADHVASRLLHLASCILEGALDLILVHAKSLVGCRSERV